MKIHSPALPWLACCAPARGYNLMQIEAWAAERERDTDEPEPERDWQDDSERPFDIDEMFESLLHDINALDEDSQ